MTEAVLICEFATAPETVPGSIFTQFCSRCFRRVMIAPSGQALLKEWGARIAVVCKDCYFASDELLAEKEIIGDFDTIVREVMGKTPNPWNKRN